MKTNGVCNSTHIKIILSILRLKILILLPYIIVKKIGKESNCSFEENKKHKILYKKKKKGFISLCLCNSEFI